MILSAMARLSRWTAACALGAALAGCASVGEETANALFAAPGKFDGYTCRQIGDRARSASTRERELEEMMARAERGAGGALVSAVAYRSDHLQARAELKLLADTAGTKNCTAETLWGNERAVW